MRKILINTRIGGYSLSDEAIREYLNAKNINFEEKIAETFDDGIIFMSNDNPDECLNFFITYEVPRDDPVLIAVVEKLGVEKASGKYCELKIVEIPDDVEWGIGQSEQGPEWVFENHRTWE